MHDAHRSSMLRAFRLVAVGALFIACTDSNAPASLRVAISPRVATLAVGDSLQLSADVTATSGKVPAGSGVIWASTDTTVLTVTASGLVHAIGSGAATISAAVSDTRDTLDITVSVHFTSLAASSAVLCLVAKNAAGYCRGYNTFGELGNGTTVASSTLVAVSGGHRFRTIQPGIESTCGLTTDSLAYCWGYGGVGSLGTGDTLTRLVPTPVSGGLRFGAIAQGELHACGLTQLGTPYCWGVRAPGEPGDSTVPSPVPGTPALVTLAAGGFSDCGLTASGAAYCWGDNYYGQLGAVTDTIFHTPMPVLGGQTYSALSSHAGPCGLTPGGEVYCWGAAAYESHRVVSPTLQPLPAGVTFTAISTGRPHICGVGSDSAMYCSYLEEAPAIVPGGLKFTSVGSGDFHDCGVTADSAAYCWLFHCAYTGDVVCSVPPVPRAVPSPAKFTQVASGGDLDSCGLASDGTVSCWRVDQDTNTAPVLVPGGHSFRSLTVGDADLRPVAFGSVGCGLATDSTAWCWSMNVGTGFIGAPQPVPGGLAYVSFDADHDHTCGITANGAAYCWLHTDPGPILVPGGGTFVSVATVYATNCAITTTGTVSCWGSNSEANLGIGYASSQPFVPVPVMGGRSFSVLAVAGDHSCGLTADSTAYCWGLNLNGALGTGDTTSSVAPVQVATSLHFASLTTGPFITCGLIADGSAYCWGRGMLTPRLQQTGTPLTSLTPSEYSQACGITIAGDLACWEVPPPFPTPRRSLVGGNGRAPLAARLARIVRKPLLNR